MPGGAFFGSRIGKNTSSNSAINGDNYPRLTYYIAYTLNSAMGRKSASCKRRRSAKSLSGSSPRSFRTCRTAA
jgi:hypothetical protein